MDTASQSRMGKVLDEEVEQGTLTVLRLGSHVGDASKARYSSYKCLPMVKSRDRYPQILSTEWY